MSAVASAQGRTRLPVIGILAATVRLLVRRPAAFLGTSFLVAMAGGALQAALAIGGYERLASITQFVVLALLSALLTAMVIRETGQGDPGLGLILKGILPTLLAVVVTTFLASLGAMIAAAFLIVPGLFLYTSWWLGVPACVAERLGPIGALGRSYRLVAGHRWGIFGLVGVTLLLETLAGLTFQAVAGRMLPSLLALVLVALATCLQVGASTLAYLWLRQAKEGIDAVMVAADL